LARKEFLLDPSNVAVTSTALGIGVLGAAAIEATWWIRAKMLGVQPRLWREPAGSVRATSVAGAPAS
jgi:cation-transporting ATPase E